MTFESVVTQFGYPAIFIGTFLEGETILIIGGFIASQGYLNIFFVITAAFLGSLFGDQLYFFLGRYKGLAILKRYKAWEGRIARFQSLLDRYGTLIIFGFRFMYGLRTISPFAIGLCKISVKKFLFLNMISAAVWAIALGVSGYYFGRVMESVINNVKRYELVFIAGLFMISVILFIIKRVRNRKRDSDGGSTLPTVPRDKKNL
jgi:membrane protein DedA with SNARE-associated domain